MNLKKKMNKKKYLEYIPNDNTEPLIKIDEEEQAIYNEVADYENRKKQRRIAQPFEINKNLKKIIKYQPPIWIHWAILGSALLTFIIILTEFILRFV